MRYHEISEAPIADFGIVNPKGDVFVNDFDRSDKGILNNQKGIKKISDAFEKTPFNFNIYIIMTPTMGIWGNEATSFEEAKELIKDYIGKDVITQNHITCIYLNNTSRRHRMPMNAWTIAHRIIHMMQVYPNKAVALEFERTCWSRIVDIAKKYTNIPNPTFIGDGVNMISPESQLVTFATALMTMKSARDNHIATSLDVGGELLAQYLLTGKIKLAPWDIAKKRLQHNETLHHSDEVGVRVHPNTNDERLSIMIQEAEDAMNSAAQDQLKNLVGKILWF